MKINKILVLEGGFNEEHKVSLQTSKEVKKVLKKNNYYFKTLLVNPQTFEKKIKKYKKYICFNALHGPYGEDGNIQSIIKRNKIKYTHSGIVSSKLCFNKIQAKNIILKNKINTPKYLTVSTSKFNKDLLLKIKEKFKKFIIKPNKSGSSFGIKIVRNNKDLKILTNNLLNLKNELLNHKNLLIEELIDGIELTVSTIKFSKEIKALAVTEIKSKNNFFDYNAKYSKGLAKKVLPANISQKNYEKCLQIAVKIHRLLGEGKFAEYLTEEDVDESDFDSDEDEDEDREYFSSEDSSTEDEKKQDLPNIKNKLKKSN